MPDNLQSKNVLIHDNGLFPWLALVLAPHFGKMRYYMPFETAFSARNQWKVGRGMPGVERVDDWESHVDDTDLFIFPDVNFPERQLLLQDMGKRVWGSRRGEQLEFARLKAKKLMAKEGLNVGEYAVVKGTSDLRTYCKRHPDVWIKDAGSPTREFETTHAESYDLIEPWIDQMDHRLGRDADDLVVICEKSIPDALEVALDIPCVDGKFPKRGALGVECKSKGYICRGLPASEWPKQLVEQNSLLAPHFAKWKYRNLFSLETRVTKDGTAYAIDPCCRFGSPSSETLMLMYANFPEMLYAGAAGEMADPQWRMEDGKPLVWGAQLIIFSSWAEDNWQPVYFPQEVLPYVSLRYCSYEKGHWAVRPQPSKLSHIGSVVALGRTMKEAVERCKANAEKVKGYGIEVYPDALDECSEEFGKFKQYGLVP